MSDKFMWPQEASALVQSVAMEGQPLPFLERVDRAIDMSVGRIFSTYLLLHANGEGERVYSSAVEHFPLGGRKPLAGTHWTTRVQVSGTPYLVDNVDEIRQTYKRYDLLEELGVTLMANVPIVYDNTVVGSINIGSSTGRYTLAGLEPMRTFAALLAPTFALLRMKQ